MMDVSRHFFSVKFIKKHLETLSLHKINKFHWHLTDDQGWRIEIKKYPELTQIGAYRDSFYVNAKPYGGFYTTEDIKEIIEYANNLCIEVIPEIDIPGHSTAAIASLPWLSCINEELEVTPKWGVHNKILCAGKETTFEFIENILREVSELFPSRYIHIGGDEAVKDYWKTCPYCKKRMDENGIKDLHGLQSYLIKRVGKIIGNLGKEMLGWEEILEGGAPKEATVYSWRGVEAGITAANNGSNVIMCSEKKACYFDHYHNTDPDELGRLKITTVKNTWDFNPLPHGLTETAKSHVLGVQGNVWTEGITHPYIYEYMTFPRLTTLCETMWSGTENRNWDEFKIRLGKFKSILGKKNVNYYNGTLE
jgi:hexosaminidase